MLNTLLSGTVIFVTHALEAVTGFGCTVLAMPFVSYLLGVQQAVMVCTVIAWLLALYIVITKWKDIEWKTVGTIISCMLLGLPFGMHLFQHADSSALKLILAVFIVAVSAFQLAKLLAFSNAEPKPAPKGIKLIPYIAFLILGGVVHGAFSSGGPLVVLYAAKALPRKKAFRASLCVVWLVLNTIIIGSYFRAGSGFSGQTFSIIAWMLPFLAAGIFTGEKIHGKVNARAFSLIVFSMLLLTGAFMIIFR